MPLGRIFGSRNRNTQTTSVDIVNQNQFNPEITNNIVLDGLEQLGAFIRDGINNLAGASRAQVQATNQSGLNIASVIDGAGVNISNSLLGASDNLSQSVDNAGRNLAFAGIAGTTILAAGTLLRRG